jgi:VanZ family protein
MSHQSGLPSIEVPIPHLDKWVHFTYFLLGGALFVLSWGGERRSWMPWGSIFLFAALGAADEWHQSFVPGRSGLDSGDWIADCLGSAIGVRLALLKR